MKVLNAILSKNNVNDEKILAIIQEYLPQIIPSTTKARIRGLVFNEIIRDTIINLNLDRTKFEITFEKRCKLNFTAEIPDWVIFEKKTNKSLIGMNQIDLWGGGQQRMRGSHYLLGNKNNTRSCKVLCVICNFRQFKTERTKAFHLFKVGFKRNTICYRRSLYKAITDYFNII